MKLFKSAQALAKVAARLLLVEVQLDWKEILMEEWLFSKIARHYLKTHGIEGVTRIYINEK